MTASEKKTSEIGKAAESAHPSIPPKVKAAVKKLAKNLAKDGSTMTFLPKEGKGQGQRAKGRSEIDRDDEILKKNAEAAAKEVVEDGEIHRGRRSIAKTHVVPVTPEFPPKPEPSDHRKAEAYAEWQGDINRVRDHIADLESDKSHLSAKLKTVREDLDTLLDRGPEFEKQEKLFPRKKVTSEMCTACGKTV